MQLTTGTVVGGKIIVEGDPLPEGTVVTILAREGDEHLSFRRSSKQTCSSRSLRRKGVRRYPLKNCSVGCVATPEPGVQGRSHAACGGADRTSSPLVSRELACRPGRNRGRLRGGEELARSPTRCRRQVILAALSAASPPLLVARPASRVLPSGGRQSRRARLLACQPWNGTEALRPAMTPNRSLQRTAGKRRLPAAAELRR